jgi:hypothetical protein
MTKSQNKTKPTDEDVAVFLATLGDEQRRDSEILVSILQDISAQPPVMWGSSIIGFGQQQYVYASGRKGDWMKIGFAPRKGQLSIYATCDVGLLEDELAKLGTYTVGKSCIYIKRLSDVDMLALKKLLQVAYDKAGKYASR